MTRGLDPNRRLPDGTLKPQARKHPEDFTRNTGEGGELDADRTVEGGQPVPADAAIIPSDSPGG
jgi:hypothetical protein